MPQRGVTLVLVPEQQPPGGDELVFLAGLLSDACSTEARALCLVGILQTCLL